MRPYGDYWKNPSHRHKSGFSPDVADTQTGVLKGCRVRNKKGKRRVKNKTTRQQTQTEICKLLDTYQESTE